MIKGNLQLQPFLEAYQDQIGQTILEVGPFFNPIIQPHDYPGSQICYWENDPHVLQYLAGQFGQDKVHFIKHDINQTLTDGCFEQLELFSQNKIEAINSVVVSQVFNYIDYEGFIEVVRKKLDRKGLLFLNNVIDYGLPMFFSDKRPKSIEETIITLENKGFEVLYQRILQTENLEFQKNDRLLLVARSVSE